jgi:hypothetical protein
VKGVILDTVKKNENTRQIYEKPKLRVIELAAEEVMGTGCKLVTGISIGKNNFPCASNACISKSGS